ncbi:MAG TPA: oligoendopeptidase F [Bacillota bacterium]|nr:oligoendopeptidase F [Bacillota bacterium]HPF42655.1 oligoendopeptidase F [Bacillota bacterium]HPJ85522.1 oligoendopeptidase F [Bacillota bacterium]HPQ62088.1 oligoendopeptidase F [Bacillota bacterium]
MNVKWDLTYLFPNVETYDKAYRKTLDLIDKLATFKGKLGDEADFKVYFLLQKDLQKTGWRAYQYAALLSDLDKKNTENASRLQLMQIAFAKLQQAVSFEEPELISIGREKVLSFVDNNPELKEFRFGFEKLFRRQEHILDDKSESLLAGFGKLADAGKDLYGSLSVADIEHQDVMLDSGDIVQITNSNYRAYIQKSQSPSERKDIFDSVFSYYDVHKNTYASIYRLVLDYDIAMMKARKYPNSLESYLFKDAIPASVYKSLCNVARKNTGVIKKYLKIRKDYLGLEEYHTYDRFIPLARSDKEYGYDEARNLFFSSLEKFPADFKNKAMDVLKEGFVDVYEQPGKRTGAYSSSMPDTHPYILLNYSGTLEDVFTVAHEAGHSIHSLYSAETQPSALQDYTIFVAEVASTFNEHNLLDYFIRESKATKNEKIMLLQRAIDDIMSTFYRQTLFAIYEAEAHEKAENGEAITADVLSDIMIDLYKEFYGLDIVKEEVKQYVWAYIPHLFYTPFYVYQYATSFAASLKLYENVKNGVPGAFENYIGLLKSGGSDYPVNQLQTAGVDLTADDAFLAVVRRMEELVGELEVAIAEK